MRLDTLLKSDRAVLVFEAIDDELGRFEGSSSRRGTPGRRFGQDALRDAFRRAGGVSQCRPPTG